MVMLGPGSPFRGPPFTTEVQIKNRGEPGVACRISRSSALFQPSNCFRVNMVIFYPFDLKLSNAKMRSTR
jgi:hypothetical protein